MSIRRACGNLLLDTSTFHYRSRRPDQAALKERIKDICETRVRYGYRRVHVMSRREGWFVNQKKVRRIYDTWSRYVPAIDARYSYRGEDVVQTMERVCAQTGYPKMIRVDQGSEFISRDLDLWAYANNVTLDFSRPGKPTDNAFIEAFNGRLRAECLSANWFMSLPDAREKLECWRRDYNTVRPHSAIGNKPPVALINHAGVTSPPA